MFYREHGPPHFHATYGEFDVQVSIRDGLVNGRFPARALRLVLEWQMIHKEELLDNWELARQRMPLKTISPLE
jgi:hypothetical protein